MDLLMLQIEQIQFTENDNALPKGSKERLYAVKNFLESKLEPQFSLKTLATQFGTNEFTLKREFKQLFGKSVFDYWNAIQMGYSNAQNFSTAFKRRYGISPSFYKTSG